MWNDLNLVLNALLSWMSSILNSYLTVGLFSFALALIIFSKVTNTIKRVQSKR